MTFLPCYFQPVSTIKMKIEVHPALLLVCVVVPAIVHSAPLYGETGESVTSSITGQGLVDAERVRVVTY